MTEVREKELVQEKGRKSVFLDFNNKKYTCLANEIV